MNFEKILKGGYFVSNKNKLCVLVNQTTNQVKYIDPLDLEITEGFTFRDLLVQHRDALATIKKQEKKITQLNANVQCLVSAIKVLNEKNEIISMEVLN